MSKADQEQMTATVPRFLLIAGDEYRPPEGNKGWRGFFHSKEEATRKGSDWLWYEVIDLKSYEVEK